MTPSSTVKLQISWHKVIKYNDEAVAISPKEIEVMVRKLMDDALPRYDIITGVELGYYAFHDVGKSIKEAVPVWAFEVKNENRKTTFYFNAISGELIDSQKHLQYSFERENNKEEER